MKINNDVVEAIGNTPLIKLKRASEATGCTILGKAEFMNPGQSVKDRAALFIIRDAIERGTLRPGGRAHREPIRRDCPSGDAEELSPPSLGSSRRLDGAHGTSSWFLAYAIKVALIQARFIAGLGALGLIAPIMVRPICLANPA